MTRYSKRVREEAALICAIAASNSDMADSYGVVVINLGWAREPAYGLAMKAWRHAFNSITGSRLGADTVDAEAEAMIRSGEI
jgi:hypothetical protein